MREGFHNDLDWLTGRVEESLAMVRDALELTVEAIIECNMPLADAVIAGDDAIDRLCQTVQTEMLGIVARQAPVAGDLRLLTGMGFMAVHIERMGDGCVNVAKLVKLAGPSHYDTGIQSRIAGMGQSLLRMIDQAARAFDARDVAMAQDLVRMDDAIDDANLRIFAEAVRPDLPPDARTWAAYMMLIGRAMERVGDHIVDLGEQIAFIVTGEFEEFTDASHPTATELRNGV
jgi:phosphate transport system protein